MSSILVVKYPRPITSLENNAKEFEIEASNELFKTERAHTCTKFLDSKFKRKGTVDQILRCLNLKPKFIQMIYLGHDFLNI